MENSDDEYELGLTSKEPVLLGCRPDPPSYRSSRNSLGYRPMLSLVVSVFCQLLVSVDTSGEGCSRIETMVAGKRSCVVKNSGGLRECTFSQTTQVGLSPQGQSSCLLFHTDEDKLASRMVFSIKSVGWQCKYKTRYFTRDVVGKYKSVHTCGGQTFSTSGACERIKPLASTVESRPEEMDEITLQKLGILTCHRGCKCAGCSDCTSCALSTVLTKWYLEPTSSHIYEVGWCPDYDFRIDMDVQYIDSTEIKKEEVNLVPGTIVKSSIRPEVTFTLLSVSVPQAPALSQWFIKGPNSIAMIDGAIETDPIRGTYSQLVCLTREGAAGLRDCKFADVCLCSAGVSGDSCNCIDVGLDSYFDSAKTLPRFVGDMEIFQDKKTSSIQVSRSGSTALTLQISALGYNITDVSDENTCVLTPVSLVGCYNCEAGAQFTFMCATNFGQAAARVLCSVGSPFSVMCEVSSTQQKIIRLFFSVPTINTVCTVSCPAGESSFGLQGSLVFIPEVHHSNRTNVGVIVHSGEDTSEGMFGVLGETLASASSGVLNWFKNYYFWFFVIIGAIVVVMILMYLSPYIMMRYQARKLTKLV
jgi:hypothetical protein